MIRRLSFLESYKPSVEVAQAAAALHEHLGELAATGTELSDGLVVRTGKFLNSRLFVVGQHLASQPRFAVVIGSLGKNNPIPPHAVLKNLVCVPNFPRAEMVEVYEVAETAKLAGHLGQTHFTPHDKYAVYEIVDEEPRFAKLMQDLYDPPSPLANFDTGR